MSENHTGLLTSRWTEQIKHLFQRPETQLPQNKGVLVQVRFRKEMKRLLYTIYSLFGLFVVVLYVEIIYNTWTNGSSIVDHVLHKVASRTAFSNLTYASSSVRHEQETARKKIGLEDLVQQYGDMSSVILDCIGVLEVELEKTSGED